MVKNFIRVFVAFSCSFATLALGGSDCYGQSAANAQIERRGDSSSEMIFFYSVGSSTLIKEYRSNKLAFQSLDRILNNERVFSKIDSIVIRGTASPEGNVPKNLSLAEVRGSALKTYILKKYPTFGRDKIIIYPKLVDWVDLRSMMADDPSMPTKDQVLSILDLGLDDTHTIARLKALKKGLTFAYITKQYGQWLRLASAVVYYQKERPVISRVDTTSVVKVTERVIEKRDTVKVEVVRVDTLVVKDKWVVKPVVALKTNLLFDAATLVNFELEVPIGKRWSVAAEWMFPWWRSYSKQNCLELNMGTLEGRYWFGSTASREKRPSLTGWFAGVYGAYGSYDFERNFKGMQGKIINAGISAGYAHTLNRAKTLRLEYSIGVGYLQTDPWQYVAKQDVNGEWRLAKTSKRSIKTFAVPQHVTESDIWLFPYRAKVSLVWMLNHKSLKKGGAK